MRQLLLTILILFQVLLSPAGAQRNYPIYVSPTLTPPYTLRLSDYSNFGSQRLMVAITVNDLNISNLPVKLRIKMETAGITIENPVTLATTPIYLNGGSTSILFADDLTDYFNINNLIFKGYSKEAYSRTGQLPEGFYRFTIEVLHYHTNRVISNQGTTAAWIAVGKPPVLRAPDDGARMGQYAGMPLTFSWLPSNVGSPMSAGNIRYQFEMWEMRVPGISPYTVAASMPVFHDNTSFSTSYSLYPATLMMEPGMTYAWRVTASDAGGFVPFEQDGHSQVRTFTYKALCDTVTGFTATAKGQSGLFCWEPGAGHTSYQIEMRQPETGWFNASETFDSKAEFFDLTPGTTYQMRVKSTCNSDPTSVSDFTTWRSLTVPVPKPLVDTLGCPTCGCDDNLPGVELTNFTLRDNLAPGDTIANKTGTTRFILKSVESQGSGTYKGIFLYWAEIWGVKFVCQYTDLQVNTDNVIVNMDFESVYDPQFMLDVDAATDYFNSLAGNLTVLTTSTAIKDTMQVTQSFDAIYVNGGDSLMAVSVDANGNITETVLAASTDNLGKTLVKGPDGQEYVVTNDGQVMGVKEYKATGGNSRLMKDHNSDKEQKVTSPSVSFSASTGQKYGFDAFTPIKQSIQSHYPQLPPSGGAPVPFKSVASFATDRVGVSAPNGITFKDEMGIPALASGNDLTIRGSANGSTIGLYAYRAVNDTTEEVVGKLNIMSFDEQPKRLIIVPVNGATLPDATALQQTLNTIYAQAVTRWSVTTGAPLTVTFPGGTMTHGGSSALAAYNADQKLIINTYDASLPSGLDKDALYLFFIDNVDGKAGVAGFMPLQRQCGFIYGSPELNIVAHELGHGAFNLYHTFSSENYIAKEQSTDNLMDYKGGTELWKYQWENVQDPQRVWMSWAQGEQEGEAIENPIELIKKRTTELSAATGLEVFAVVHAYYCCNDMENKTLSNQFAIDVENQFGKFKLAESFYIEAKKMVINAIYCNKPKDELIVKSLIKDTDALPTDQFYFSEIPFLGIYDETNGTLHKRCTPFIDPLYSNCNSNVIENSDYWNLIFNALARCSEYIEPYKDEATGKSEDKNMVFNSINIIRTYYAANKRFDETTDNIVPPLYSDKRIYLTVEDVKIGNVLYPYVTMVKISNDLNVDVRNIKVESAEADCQRSSMALNIDGKLLIIVPNERVNDLKNFLTLAENGLTVFANGFDPLYGNSMVGTFEYVNQKIAEVTAQYPYMNVPLAVRTNVRDAILSYLTEKNSYYKDACAKHIDEVLFYDFGNYWGEIDDLFNERIGTKNVVYADGSYPASTAGNSSGFNIRKNGGRKAGEDIVKKIENGSIFVNKQTPINVVSHSMGFAYALGIIETLKDKGYTIGHFYCIAPENPSEGYVPSGISGIWQYGSNEDEDSFFKQDLIAPQAPIGGIDREQRVFIPITVQEKWPLGSNGWLSAHSIANYKWIFELLNEGDNGYVSPK
jgi:hypothetical protein